MKVEPLGHCRLISHSLPLFAAGGKGELEVRVVDKDTGKPIAARMHLGTKGSR
jgi:hypothetical protein